MSWRAVSLMIIAMDTAVTLCGAAIVRSAQPPKPRSTEARKGGSVGDEDLIRR